MLLPSDNSAQYLESAAISDIGQEFLQMRNAY